MVMLNVSDDIAEKIRAYGREHGLEDPSAVLLALLEAEEARVRRVLELKGLIDLAGTIDFDAPDDPR